MDDGSHWAPTSSPCPRLRRVSELGWWWLRRGHLPSRLSSHFPAEYEMRSLRATVLEKLEPLHTLKSAREFAQVFFDILQIHRWLYEHPQILHRDLSMANIMYRREDDKVYGALSDFDLSSFRDSMNDGPTSKHRTGTKPFMAFDLLNAGSEQLHRYRHDLKSLFYIILIYSSHYSDPTTRASSLPFKLWLFVQLYFNNFTQWLAIIRRMLDKGYKSLPSTDDDYLPEEEQLLADLYDWDTLDVNFTYTKVMDVMRFFGGRELVTRWNGERRD
ncbi:hypothetical protein D9757_011698 [Collybiopsis confluens]|uniref:Protein kinase domain-containing protein n=1 Tax=Collybiopsis confluens TaxID=2823264 RepID=A0A8H5GLI7_9AGAR|nr:hypothetical protein D9757_011698 [Collybiopsis confluens]